MGQPQLLGTGPRALGCPSVSCCIFPCSHSKVATWNLVGSEASTFQHKCLRMPEVSPVRPAPFLLARPPAASVPMLLQDLLCGRWAGVKSRQFAQLRPKPCTMARRSGERVRRQGGCQLLSQRLWLEDFRECAPGASQYSSLWCKLEVQDHSPNPQRLKELRGEKRSRCLAHQPLLIQHIGFSRRKDFLKDFGNAYFGRCTSALPQNKIQRTSPEA